MGYIVSRTKRVCLQCYISNKNTHEMRHDESMKGVIYNHIHDLKFTRAYKQNTANSFVLKIHVVCVYGVGLGVGGGGGVKRKKS